MHSFPRILKTFCFVQKKNFSKFMLITNVPTIFLFSFTKIVWLDLLSVQTTREFKIWFIALQWRFRHCFRRTFFCSIFTYTSLWAFIFCTSAYMKCSFRLKNVTQRSYRLFWTTNFIRTDRVIHKNICSKIKSIVTTPSVYWNKLINS